MARRVCTAACIAFAFLCAARVESAEPSLATLEYQVVSTELRVTPVALSVPKGVEGSVLVELAAGGETDHALVSELSEGAYVEATLRGPSFDARRVVGAPNAPLLLPPLNQVGDYQLDNIRLVDSLTGATRLEAVPSSVPVRVFEEVLVSKVTSRPLTYAEIQEKGIHIDEQNFRAVEFEVGFVLEGKTFEVNFPVVAPTFKQSTEIIPPSELEAALAEANEMNRQIASEIDLPSALETSGLNFDLQAIQFQRVEENEEDLALSIPPIPALLMVPGNIGFLNQFFSVQVFTENAAPIGSGLTVNNVTAELSLPAGPDRIPGVSYENPGDDPLRFARVGADQEIHSVVPVVQPGIDGTIGTDDDIFRLRPGESGQGEFLVEGLQEGLHVMDLDLTADLEGLAAGTVKVKGKASGSVLVRNANFSFAFSHPRTIRSGEPYEATITILNTSQTDANQVSVTLRQASISGAVVESPETIALGNIPPGETRTATWKLRAQRTGAISFSNLTTGDDAVTGRFRLRMGVDERGVALSPDTIVMPDQVRSLPENLLNAANRVLGQALSVATAPVLPAGVVKTPKSIVTRRVLELAEAGQRLSYGDLPERVLPDLLLDWQGARETDAGFDQILRTTEAGWEWRQALLSEIESLDVVDASARLANWAADLAGRSEAWKLAASSQPELQLALEAPEGSVTAAGSDVPQALAYEGMRGQLLPSPVKPVESDSNASGPANCVFTWQSVSNIASAELSVLVMGTSGVARRLTWALEDIPQGARFQHTVADTSELLEVDLDGDGTLENSLAAAESHFNERAPEIIAVFQDISVNVGRPNNPCDAAPAENYGTVLAVLYSKPMSQSTAAIPEAYRLDNGVTAGSVQIQPDGRVALLNMKQPLSAIRPRSLTVSGVADQRGNLVAPVSHPVITDFRGGTAISGRVVRADGSPAAGIPVTLTMYEKSLTVGDECVPFVVRVCQVFTDQSGLFEIDFVLAGIEYSISATDTSNLSPEEIDALLEASVDDQVQRSRMAAILQAAAADTLLGTLFDTTLPEAIAKAEGVERAVLRDKIVIGSGREGTVTPFALRFRGKGTVSGRVVLADGVTPAPGAAVNIYPDPSTRQQPRGVFSDSNGRFAFLGVPLGLFTVAVQTDEGLYRTIAGEISEIGQTQEYEIVLAGAKVETTGIRGRVYEADHTTPHALAKVFVAKREGDGVEASRLVAYGQTVADADGYWSVSDIPVGAYEVIAISFNGRRSARRTGILADLGGESFVNVALPTTAEVYGRVEFANGYPAAQALVAGGEVLVEADDNGFFRLTGVPTGIRSVSAGIGKNTFAGVHVTRLGSASVNVVPGVSNYVVIRLQSKGRIVGRVYDATGTNVVPHVRVAMPRQGGFFWVKSDAEGRYEFPNMELGSYTLSAPAPQVFETDTTGLIAQIRTGSEEEIQAAVGEAYEVFTGVADPYLNGEASDFNPFTWGFVETELVYDNQTVVADIVYLRQGSVSGKVVNSQGVPIGARVRLTGIGPSKTGQPTTRIRGERNSDPATGEFRFDNALLEGPWQLQAASPFYPAVITESGFTFWPELNVPDVELQFPPVREVNGRLVGNVFMPDGSTAGSNVNVRISFGSDYVIQTDENGFFDTQVGIPRGTYSVTATSQGGYIGIASVQVQAGVTNVCDVTLLDFSTVIVEVQNADGSPSPNTEVRIEQGNWPYARYNGTTDEEGTISFIDIYDGCYGAVAWKVSGPTTIYGRTGTSCNSETRRIVVQLEPTGSIRGRFVRRDRVTPVDAAQVAIGNVGFAITDADGMFTVEGIPLGTYRLLTQNPVNGVGAKTFVTLNADGQVREVVMIEQFRGEVQGYVIDSYGVDRVPGATVVQRVNDELTPPRSITTGPDGFFSFPGTPAASFSLSATDPVTKLRGSKTAALEEGVPVLQVDVPIEPLTSLSGRVFEPDGVTPAANAQVQLSGPGSPFGDSLIKDTDADGYVSYSDLKLGNYNVRADSLVPETSYSASSTNLALNSLRQTFDFRLVLPGVGGISGLVTFNDGVTAVEGAAVHVVVSHPLFGLVRKTTFTDSSGRFQIENIPLGDYTVTAEYLALAGSYHGRIERNGSRDFAMFKLGAAGVVQGVLVREDGVTPVEFNDVVIFYVPQANVEGQNVVQSLEDGFFQFENVPIGPFSVQSHGFDFDGIAISSSELFFNMETNDLGRVVFDEAPPAVVQVTPPDGGEATSIFQTVELLFSEPLESATVLESGIYLLSEEGRAPATPQYMGTNDLGQAIVRLIMPEGTALRSQSSYYVVVLDGDRRGGQGPLDRVGRPMAAPFLSRFVTPDNDRPVLVSAFPAEDEEQIDPRSVMRFSFNEPIRETGIEFAVRAPDGAIVPGEFSVGFKGLVLAFAPTSPLEVNAQYTMSVGGVRDLAGNLWRDLNDPWMGAFETLDTIGPEIAELRLANEQAPVAGATLPVEAILAADEPGANVRYEQDFKPVGLAVEPPYIAGVTLPTSGSTTIRAYASDRFNNEGPFAELTLEVVPNTPPQLLLSRGEPASGPVGSGQEFTVLVTVSDDVAVADLTLMTCGAFFCVNQSSPSNLINGKTQSVTIQTPPTLLEGEAFQVRAQALDALGAASPIATLDYTVIDRTPPSLAILSPPADAFFEPGDSFELKVTSADNSTEHRLEVDLSGAWSGTAERDLITTTNTTVTNTFGFTLTGAKIDGTPLLVTVRGTDAAGNTDTVIRSFRLPDTGPPQITSVIPSPGSGGHSLWLDNIVLSANESLATDTVHTNSVFFTHNGEVEVEYDASLGAEPQNIQLQLLSLPLRPDVTYTSLVTSAITDLSGNQLVQSDGTPLPEEGLPFTFTTAKILEVAPADGSQLVPGQAFAARVDFEAGLGAHSFRFELNNNSPVDIPVAEEATQAMANLRLSADAASATLNIAARHSGQPDYILPPINFELRARELDDDGDGWANGYEADRGMNPFVAELDTDDFEGDGLNNGDERAYGTDPANPDTDGDTLSDAAEVAAGTDPTNPDTDGDGLRDDVDPTPEVGDSPPVVTVAETIHVIQGQSTNVLVSATDEDNNLREFKATSLDGKVTLRWTAHAKEEDDVVDAHLLHPQPTEGLRFTTWPVLPAALPRRSYSIALSAVGGVAPYTFAIVDGALPEGLMLQPDGTIIGTPEDTGFSSFRVRVSDLFLQTAEQLVALRVTNNRNLDNNASPTGYWPAEGDATDWVGSDDGIPENAPDYVAGQVGQAFSFTGDDRIQFNSQFALHQPGDASVQFWLKSPPTAYQNLFWTRLDGTDVNRFNIAVRDGSTLEVDYREPNGTLHLAGFSAPMPADAWNHIAIVRTGNTYTIYVNGQAASTAVDDAPALPTAVGWQISGRPGYFLVGQLDELTTYHRALQPAEVGMLYNFSYPPALLHFGNGLLLSPDRASAMSELLVNSLVSGTSTVDVVVGDATGLATTNRLKVIALADLDLDGIPDEDDPDRDGDGVPNDTELTQGSDPDKRDTDGDKVPDGDDPAPLMANEAPLPMSLDAGYAARFDGVDDYLEVPGAVPFNYGTAPFTVEGWFQVDGSKLAANTDYGLVNRNSGQTGNRGWGVQISTKNGVYPEFTLASFITGQSTWCNSCAGPADRLSADAWHHFAMVRSDSTLSLYINGELTDVRRRQSIAGDVDSSLPIVFGDHAWGPTLPGQLDEIRLWNVARSGEEVAADYARRLNGDENGLVGYWRFDAGSGNEFADSTNGGHNAAPGANESERAAGWALSGAGVATGGIVEVSSTDITVPLQASDPDGDPVSLYVVELPRHGNLYQTDDGVTRGSMIVNVPMRVTDPVGRVIHFRDPGYSGLDDFRYLAFDSYTNSVETASITLDLVTPADFDLDGDGMPDVYELAHGLDQEFDDAAEDSDTDNLTNIDEYERGTLPNVRDTDHDKVADGDEVALGLNPLLRDTDGDGLLDNSDPNPDVIQPGLSIEGPAAVTINELQSSNVVVTVTSPSAPLVLVDFWPTNPAPSFASISSVRYTNTSSNGTAVATLAFNPLHNVASNGLPQDYTISLRAAATDGLSGRLDVGVTVNDEPALDAFVTRWAAPVDGNWNDPANWTAGVPASDQIAVIDATGLDYVVTLNVAVECRSLVVDSGDVLLDAQQHLTVNGPTEVRAGAVRLAPGRTMTLNGAAYWGVGAELVLQVQGADRDGHLVVNDLLVNRGTIEMEWTTRHTKKTQISGAGRLVNEGIVQVVEIDGDLGRYRFPAEISVPLEISRSGRLVVGENSMLSVFEEVINGGLLEIAQGATLTVTRIDGGTVTRLAMLTGAQVAGAGTLILGGGNRLEFAEDLEMEWTLSNGGVVAGEGVLRLRGQQPLTGTYDCPVVVAADAVVTLEPGGGATFNGPVEVEAGGRVVLQVQGANRDGRLVVNDLLVNRGTIEMEWTTRHAKKTQISGAGRLVNEGIVQVVEIDGDLGRYRFPAEISVPLEISRSGRLVVGENSMLSVFEEVINGGLLEIAQGATLTVTRIDGGTVTRLAMLTDAQVAGAGTLILGGGNRLEFAEDLEMEWTLSNGGVVAGEGVLRLRGQQAITGTYDCPVVVAADAVVTLEPGGGATFNGPVEVEAGGRVVLQVQGANRHGRLVVNDLLVNRGTIEMEWTTRHAKKTQISGAGRLVNEGIVQVVEIDGDLGRYRFPVEISVPLEISRSGRLVVGENSMLSVFEEVINGGLLEIAQGATLTVTRIAGGTASRLAMLTGAQVAGAGTLILGGGNRLEFAEDLEMEWTLSNGGVVAGEGVLRLRGQQAITGTYDCPVVVAADAVVTLEPGGGATFNGPVEVEAGGRVVLQVQGANRDGRLVVNDLLVNRGTIEMEWTTRHTKKTQISGAGRLVNEGIVQVVEIDGDWVYRSPAEISVPLEISRSGRLVVGENSMLSVFEEVINGGLLEIAQGATLTVTRIAGGTASRLAMLTGAQVAGAGTLILGGGNRLEFAEDLEMEWTLSNGGVVAGEGVLRLRGQQAITGTYDCPVVVAADAVVTVEPGVTTTMNGPVEVEPGGRLLLQAARQKNAHLVVNDLLVNRGTIEMVAGYYNGRPTISGSGRLLNQGLVQVVDKGPDDGYGARFSVPVEVSGTGRLLVGENSMLEVRDNELLNRGIVGIAQGATLTVRSSVPRFGLLGGSRVVGSGSLRFENNTAVEVAGNASIEPRLFMGGSTMALGPGLLTLKNYQELTGFYGCPVALAAGSEAVIQSASFTNHVMIASNAVLSISDHHFMRNEGVITNYGEIYLAGGYENSYDRLTGNGCLVNGGNCEVYLADTNDGAVRVHNALAVLPSSQMTINTNAHLWLGPNSCLLNAGTLEVQAGATLEMTEAPSRDFVLYANSQITGSGVTTIGGDNRLLVLGSSTLADGTLRLVDASTMAGQGRLTIAQEATFWMDHSVSFPGTVDVDGTFTLSNADIISRISGALALAGTGTLINPGTLEVGFFFDFGGTIEGSAPVLIPAGSSLRVTSQDWLRIERITFHSPDRSEEATGSSGSLREATVRWNGPGQHEFVIEVTTDFRSWQRIAVPVREIAFGIYEARVPALGRNGYFRVQSLSEP